MTKQNLRLFAKATMTFLGLFSCYPLFAASLTVTSSTYTIDATTGSKNFDNVTVNAGGIIVVDGRTLTVSGNTTGDKLEINNGGEVILKNGATLTIQNTSVNIIINPGGVMRVDNSTIHMAILSWIRVNSSWTTPGSPVTGGLLEVKNSTIDGYQWAGITVAGGSEQQFGGAPPPSGYYFSQQSKYVARALFTNSTLTGAEGGLFNYDKDNFTFTDPGTNSCGGVIQAINTQFNNNGRVHFHPYVNYLWNSVQGPMFSTKTWETSFFDNCTFNLTSTPFPSTVGFAEIEGVKNLQFRGCKFNDLSGLIAGPAVDIKNAGVFITTGCSNVNSSGGCIGSPIASEFNGMNHAISAGSAALDATLTLEIKGTTFNDIGQYGITVGNYLAPVITDNTIGTTLDNSQGINLSGCTGYRVERNEISCSYNNTTTSYGIVINNSGPSYNEVYKNKLGTVMGLGTELRYSLQANGKNYDSSVKTPGLRFLCNDMGANGNAEADDITINALTSGITGVSTMQGIDNNAVIPGTFKNAYNLFAPAKATTSGDEHIYKTAQMIPDISYYYGSGTDMPTYVSSGVNVIFTLHTNTCPTTSETYKNPTLPFSEKIVKRADIEDELALLEPCDYETVTSCDYDRKLVEYEQLNTEMLHDLLHYDEGYFVLMDSVGSDSIYALQARPELRIADVIDLLAGASYNYDYKLWLTGAYAQTGDFTNAYSTLSGISITGRNTEEVQEIDDITTLIEVMEELKDHDYDWEGLSDVTVYWLEELADNGNGYPRYLSRNILQNYGGAWYAPEATEIPGSSAKPGRPAEAAAPAAASTATAISLYPNPVTDMLQLDVPADAVSLTAELYDLTGKKLATQQLVNGKNRLDTRALAPGSYFIRIQEGTQLQSVHNIIKR